MIFLNIINFSAFFLKYSLYFISSIYNFSINEFIILYITSFILFMAYVYKIIIHVHNKKKFDSLFANISKKNIKSTSINSNDKVKSDELKNDDLKSDELKSNELKSDELKSDELKSDELKSDKVKSDELKSDKVKSDELKSDELKNDEILINENDKKMLLKLQLAPKNMSIINEKMPEVPLHIIDFVSQNNYRLSEDKKSTLGSYLIVKGFFMQLFMIDNMYFITDVKTFFRMYDKYKKFNFEKQNGYNFCLKLYSDSSNFSNKNNKNYVYIYVSNNLVYIDKNIKNINYIEKRLNKNKIFLTQHNKKIVISYGQYIICNNDFKNLRKKILNEIPNIEEYQKYDKIKIMYWTSIYV